MALQNTPIDARGNELNAPLDGLTGSTVVDARIISATLGAVNAESTTDINGYSGWLVDARTAAGNLTIVFEGTIDSSNYFTLNAYDLAAPTVAVTSVVVTTTLAKAYYVACGGFRRVRVRVSAWTSGNITVSSRASVSSLIDDLVGILNIGTLVPGVTATSLGKQRTAVIGATDTGVAVLARVVTSPTVVTNTQYDVPQLEAATGALFVNSPTAVTGILKARAAAPGATDAGVEVLCEALTVNTAVTTAQYHRPQIEAASGGLFVRDIPSTLNGLTNFHQVSAATTNATSIKASAGNVYGWSITNGSAAIKYVKLFNKASAPTVGTDVPVITIGIAATSTVYGAFNKGITFATGIASCVVGALTDLDTTAVALNDVAFQLMYK